MTNYPDGLDSFANPTASSRMDDPALDHATQHANINDAVEAIESELGLNPAGASETVRARLDLIESTAASFTTTGFVDTYVQTVLGNNVTIGGSGVINGSLVVTGGGHRSVLVANTEGGSLSLYQGTDTYPRTSLLWLDLFDFAGVATGPGGTGSVDTSLLRLEPATWTLLGGRISGAATPVSGTDLTTKDYVDSTFLESEDVRHIVKLTQAAYDALGTPDADTLYVVVG